MDRRTFLAAAVSAAVSRGLPAMGAPSKVNPTRDWIKRLGKAFGIRSRQDHKCFNHLWPTYRRARRFAKRHAADLEAEVQRAYTHLRKAVEGNPVSQLGHRHVVRLPEKGRYVVFSDHHMLYRGHRHDYFRTFGNDQVYSAVLKEYSEQEFTLIENGDVEDLVVIEPSLADVLARYKMNKDELAAHRLRYRRDQLRRIISTYSGLYQQIARDFHAQGRLIKIAGNHEQDLQNPRLLAVLQEQYPGITVYDYAVIQPRSGPASYVVAHGHQFDPACTPRFSKKVGEVISECLAWAYQGADRVWKLEDTSKWRLGTPFANVPAVGKPERDGGRGVWEAIAELAMGHEIAWEYFESKDPYRALMNEVFTGQEWFKIRHMSETSLQAGMMRAFGAGKVPTLVLGHSHEVRDLANYMNSGSAGRFEQLIWGVEIEDGVSQVVAWHRHSSGRLVRRVYERRGSNLVPSRRGGALRGRRGRGIVSGLDRG